MQILFGLSLQTSEIYDGQRYVSIMKSHETGDYVMFFPLDE